MRSEVLKRYLFFSCWKTNIHYCSLSFCFLMKLFLHSKMTTLTSLVSSDNPWNVASQTFMFHFLLPQHPFFPWSVHSHFTCPSYTGISPKPQTHTLLLYISSWMPHSIKHNTPQSEVTSGFTPPFVPACQSHVPPVCSLSHWKVPPAALLSLHSPPLYILVNNQFLHKDFSSSLSL